MRPRSSRSRSRSLPIERSERLVQQENARLGSEGARERNALLLATRQRPDRAPLEPGEADELEKLTVRARFYRLRRVAAHPESERDVAEDVAVREERVVLEDEADPTPVRWRRPRDPSPSSRTRPRSGR